MRLALGLLLSSLLLVASDAGLSGVEPLAVNSTRRGALVTDRYEPPRGGRPNAVIVLVHGCCGDRRDMADLARGLARRGALVLNSDMHAFGAGGGWPTSYLDVACSVAAARRTADQLGQVPVTLIGWDDGALVGAVVSLGWSTIAPRARECADPSPARGPDRYVGISGHYGWIGAATEPAVGDATVRWFGGPPEAEPEAWTLGNPGWWLQHGDPRDRPRTTIIGTVEDRGSQNWATELQRRSFAVTYLSCGSGAHDELIRSRTGSGAAALKAVARDLGLRPGSARAPNEPVLDVECRSSLPVDWLAQ
jgi:hypothetical protein